jgi:hypothetical protein
LARRPVAWAALAAPVPFPVVIVVVVVVVVVVVAVVAVGLCRQEQGQEVLGSAGQHGLRKEMGVVVGRTGWALYPPQCS